MCCQFEATEIVTGRKVLVRGSDQGQVATKDDGAIVVQTIFSVEGKAVSSFFTFRRGDDWVDFERLNADKQALEAFGLITDFDNVEVIDCGIAHQDLGELMGHA